MIAYQFAGKIKKNRTPKFLQDAKRIFGLRSILIFPQGDLEFHAGYKKGVAVLAKNLNCKVVPVTSNIRFLTNLPIFGEIKGFRFKDRKNFAIKINKPITYREVMEEYYKSRGMDPAVELADEDDLDKSKQNAQIFIDKLKDIIDQGN